MKRQTLIIFVICIISLIATTSFAKNKAPDYVYVPQVLKSNQSKVLDPDALVFSGGGASGVAYAGVMHYLEKAEKLKNITRYMGASAGAIFSLIFYIDMNYDEAIDLIDNIKWPSLLECRRNIPLLYIARNLVSWTTVKNINAIIDSLKNHYGLSDGKNIEKILRDLLKKRGYTDDGRVTFAELKRRIAEKEGAGVDKDLIVVAFSTSYYTTCFFSADTTPDMDVVDAVRASMAIPVVYDPVVYTGTGKKDYLVDGGTTYNYPIEYLDMLGAKSLGFVLGDPADYYSPTYDKISCFQDLIVHVFYGLFENIMPRMITNEYRTVFIDTPSVGTLSFDMTPQQMKQAIQQGYTTTQGYFEQAGPLKY